MFVFARLPTQMNEWVSWLPKPILVCLRAALLEGGASRGWRCLREALLWGGAAVRWHCSGVALIVYMDRQYTEYL